MREFFKEPWAFTLIFAILSNVVWLVAWLSMWASGRFKNSIGGGFPILLVVGLFNIPFGFVFLAISILGTLGLSAFWIGASVTNTCENERKALAAFLSPKKAATEEPEKGECKDTEPDAPSDKE